jgi:hypothetical protein
MHGRVTSEPSVQTAAQPLTATRHETLQPPEDPVKSVVVDEERDVHWLNVLGVKEHDHELGTDSYRGESAVVRDLALKTEETR